MAFDFDESGALVSTGGGFDFDESGNLIDNTPAKPRAGYQAITDTALEIGSGAAKGIKFMADAFGADNTVSKALDEVSIYAKGLQSAQAKGEDQRVAAIMQEAQDKGVWEQVKAALSAAGEAPIRQSLGAIGTGLPMIAASAVPGLREASWGTRLATLGGMGAVQGAGIAKDSIRDAVYERAKSEGYDDTTAAAAADKAQEYGGANTDQIALSGLINAGATATGFAPAALRAMSKEGVKRAVTPTLAKELGMGVVKEVPLEAVQGGQEQLAGNIAQQRTGFETPLMRGVVGQATLEGMLATPGGIAGGAMDYMAPEAKPKPDDILKAPTVDDAIATFQSVGKQWQDLGIGPQTGSLETQRLAEQAGQSFQSLGIDQGASDLATQRRDEIIAQVGEQYKALGLTDPTDNLAAQKRISEVGNEWQAIEGGKQADAEWQAADKAARIERQQEEARRLMAERDARIADAGSQAKPILDRIDAENADLEDLVQSETRSKQVMLAQLEQDRLKQAEINAAFEDKPDLDLRTKAVQQAAMLDAPTALGDKLRQALAPVKTPATPIPVAPTLPRVVDRFTGMVAMPQKLAEMTAERTGGEVVRVPNIDKTTGKPNGKFAYTVLNEQNTPAPTGTQTQAAPTQETAPAREPDTAATGVPATGAIAPVVEGAGVKEPSFSLDPMGWNPSKLADTYNGEQLNQLWQEVQPQYENRMVNGSPVDDRGMATKQRLNPAGQKIEKALKSAMGIVYQRKKNNTPTATPGAPSGVTQQPAQPITGQVATQPMQVSTNKAGNVTVYGDPAEVRKAHPQAKGVTVFADGKAAGVMFSVPDSPGVLAKINPQPQTNATQTDQTIQAQPSPQEATARQLTDDELFTQELERLYQADIKESIKQRLGLSKPVTETVQAQRNTPFKAFLKKYKIKSSLARDIFDNAFKANQALPGTFKQDGLGLDELVTMAIQSGFMLPGDVDSNNDNGGTNKLVEMIQAEIRGEAQMPIGMASDNAQESIEMRERMDLEDEADRLGLVYDAKISTDKLASMVHRVQRKIGVEKTGSLKADRVLKNAHDAAQRIERKRAELEAASKEFDKASIAKQDALLEIFMDEDGNPVIVLLSDIEANRAWYEQNPTGPQYDTSTEQDQGQVGAPDATATGQGVEDGGTTGTGTQRQDDQGQETELASYTPAEVLAEQARTEQIEKDKAKADQEAEAKAKAERIAKEIQARQEASADNFQLGQSAEDALAGQGSIFDMPEPAQQATAILDAANVTGKERIDVLKDVKQGTITPEELQAAYPATEQAEPEAVEKPSWHTDIPAKGVSVAAGDEKLDGSRQVLYRIATEAVNALTQNQKMNGQRLYAYYLPSTPTEHGALRLFPDDQTPPKPWTLLKPEGIPVGMLTPDNLIAQLRNDLQNAPVLTSGNEKEILAKHASKPSGEATKERLTDAGEELSRNRRNKVSGITWDDVSLMNDTLKVKNVTKANIWKKPDYAKMVEDGAPRWKVALLKAIYDKLAAKPSSVGAVNDEKLKRYIDTMTKARDAVMAELDRIEADPRVKKAFDSDEIKSFVSKGDDVVQSAAVMGLRDIYSKAIFDSVFPPVFVDGRTKITFGGATQQGKDNNANALIIGGNNAVGALQFNYKTVAKARDILLDGFPAKQEMWEKSYEVRSGEMRNDDIPEDQRNGQPQIRYQVFEKGSRYRLAKNHPNGGFATEDDAIAFAKETSKRAKDDKPMPPSRGLGLDDVKRTGPDWRNGKDVTSEDIKQAFGFRGVNLGEYVKANQKIAQVHLNHAYDALHDLADLIGVPAKAISLNGTLGLAIGAQGSGKALAHFVPGVNEINITRDSGAGALSHEWGHALDHYFGAKQSGAIARSKEPFLTEHVHNKAEGVRPEIMAAFKTIVDAMQKRPMTEQEQKDWLESQNKRNRVRLKQALGDIAAKDKAAYEVVSIKLLAGDVGPLNSDDIPENLAKYSELTSHSRDERTKGMVYVAATTLADLKDEQKFLATHKPQTTTNFLKASAAMDAKKTDPYWSSNVEMFARSFESYVMDALSERQRESLYLSGLADSPMWKEWEEKSQQTSPYSKEGERLAINQAVQTLVDAIETKETDTGIAMFKRSVTSVGGVSTEGSAGNEPVFAVGQGVATVVDGNEVVALVAKINAGLDTAIVQDAPTFFDLPQSVQDVAKEAGVAPGEFRGVTIGGNVYVVHNGHSSVADVESTIFHELYGHIGLRKLFGLELYKKLNDLYLQLGETKILQLVEKYKLDKNGYLDMANSTKDKASQKQVNMAGGRTELRNSYIAEELLANIAQYETGTLKQKALEIIGEIKNWLRKHWFVELARRDMSDVAYILKQSRLAASRPFGDKTVDRPMFSRSLITNAPLPSHKTANEAALSDVAINSRNAYFETLSNSSGRRSISNESVQFVKFFGELLSHIGLKPTIGKSFGDGLVRNAELLGDVTDSAAFLKHGYGGLDAPTQRMVMQSVGNAINNTEVLKSVVERIPVDVMNVLIGGKGSSEKLLNNVTMLSNSSPSDANNPVSSAINMAALVVADVAAAKRAKSSPGLWDVRLVSQVGGATDKATAGDSAHIRPWEVPEPSRMDDIIYSLQDSKIDTKRVQKAIKDAIGAIDDAANPYLQEELYHNRASTRTKKFLEQEIRPFLTELHARGVDLSDFEEYLHNRHAERRNVQVAKINPNMQDGGSGIKTADARAYLANLPQAKQQAYTALAKRIDAINKATRKLLVDSGLETQETIDAWTQAYGDEYVPLMREEMDNGRSGIGQGFSVRGGSSKRALGSDKPVANIFANIALQREKAITRSEKQKIGHALYGLVLKAPNPDFWFAIDPDLQRNPTQVMDTQLKLIDLGFDPADAESIAREPKERYYNPTTQQVDTRINPLLRSADNVLAVRIEGQDKYVFFNARDKRAMRMVSALKNLDADQLGAVMSQTAKMTRYFSAVNTQWNPIFGVTNITRDIQTALINLESTALKGHKKDVMKHIFPALRGIYIDLRDHRAGKQPTSAYAAIFEEFQREGGATGYRDMYANAEDRADAIKSEIEGIKSGKLKQAGKAVFNWLSDYNESMENAVRVAAYKVGTDNGMTKQQAASLAKNLTVNFNRKGQVALQAGALYAFFNASVQGTARIAETVMDGNKLSALGKKIVTGGLLLGGMQALLMSMADFDEDEPPDFVRERNLIIPTGGEHYISIPMPLGFHVLPNLSRIPTEWALGGFKDTPKRIGQMVGLFFDAFNPIGSAGLSLQTITPTVIDPFAALAENKDFTGKAIARKDFDPLHPTAGHTRAKDTATPWAKFTSLAINYATGGTDYKPGIVSPTPDQIDYLIGQVTGGVGREVSKSAQVFESSTSGEEIPLYKIPLVGRFLGTTEGQAPETGRFYENLKRIGEHKSEIEGLRKDRRFEESFVYMRENPESRLIKLADDAHNDVSKLNRLKRDLIKQDASKERIRLIEMQITSRMKRLNDRIKAVKELEPA